MHKYSLYSTELNYDYMYYKSLTTMAEISTKGKNQELGSWNYPTNDISSRIHFKFHSDGDTHKAGVHMELRCVYPELEVQSKNYKKYCNKII